MNQQELIEMIRNHVLVKKSDRKIIRTDGFTDAEYLFDFRNVILDQEYLPKLTRMLAKLLEPYEDYQICGLESAAIPLVTALVMITGKSGFYIRKSRKKTGLMNMIEGRVDPSKKIIIIDDIMNSGNSIMRQVRILESYGLKVAGVCAILRYHDTSWYGELGERNITIHSLISHRDIAEPLDIPYLRDVRSDPSMYEVIVPRWRFAVSDPAYQLVVPKSTPCYHNGRIYVGMDDGGLYCLDFTTGREIWKYQTPFGSKGKRILSSPCVYSNMVFFGAYDGNIYALDCDSGVPVWIDYSSDWIGSSPCAVPEMHAICIGVESSSAHARGGYELFEASTGKSIWRLESSEYTHASPVYSQKTQTIFGGSNDGIFYAIDAHTGALRWMFAAGSEIKSRAALNDSETLVAFGSFSGTVFVLDVMSGKLVASYKTDFAVYSEPCWHNRVLYFSSLDKRLYAYDIQEQVLKWEYGTAGRIFSSPVIIGEYVYIGSNDGNLHILDRESGKLMKMWLGIERITNPITSTGDGGYLVRTFANEIYAF